MNRVSHITALALATCSWFAGIQNVYAQQKAVPYFDQKDNQHEGWRACNITSVAMVLDYFNVLSPEAKAGLRTPDYLYQRFGIKQQPTELQALFNQVASEQGSVVRDVFYENGTIEQLRALARAGEPTIVHGWFTQSGHIVVVTGFDGAFYTVNDPYGMWKGVKHQKSELAYDTSVSGFGVKYPAKEFEYAINDNGQGNDLWLHTFELLNTKPAL
jgi:hypothetical protein